MLNVLRLCAVLYFRGTEACLLGLQDRSTSNVQTAVTRQGYMNYSLASSLTEERIKVYRILNVSANVKTGLYYPISEITS